MHLCCGLARIAELFGGHRELFLVVVVLSLVPRALPEVHCVAVPTLAHIVYEVAVFECECRRLRGLTRRVEPHVESPSILQCIHIADRISCHAVPTPAKRSYRATKRGNSRRWRCWR